MGILKLIHGKNKIHAIAERENAKDNELISGDKVFPIRLNESDHITVVIIR